MPEPIFFIIIVAILAGTFSGVVKMVLEYLKSRQDAIGARRGTESLTASELERLIESAVRNATTDLSDRVGALEAHTEPPRLEGPRLGHPPVEEEGERERPAARKPMRS
jgi:hypothetical protein